jgi:Putative transmembrane protein (PGPGW)
LLHALSLLDTMQIIATNPTMTQAFEEERWHRAPLDTQDAKADMARLDITVEYQTQQHLYKSQETKTFVDATEDEKALLTFLEEETHAEFDTREIIADIHAFVSKSDSATGLSRIVDSKKEGSVPSTGVDRDESNDSMNSSKDGCHGNIPLIRVSSCNAIMGHSSRKDASQILHTTKRRRHSWHGSSTSSITRDEYAENLGSSDKEAEDSSYSSPFRKAFVAVTGGTMVVVGLVMIPLPTPGGWIVATAGMMHLGQEFPAAQRILDATKERVLGAFQKKPKNESESKTSEEEQVKK